MAAMDADCLATARAVGAPVWAWAHPIGLRRYPCLKSLLHCTTVTAIDPVPRERESRRAMVMTVIKVSKPRWVRQPTVPALWCMCWLSAPVQAHLLPAQTATMNIVDRAAFFVVAVPASALHGIDTDNDGRLSPGELDRGKAQISAQFDARFHVTSHGQSGRAVLTWVSPPEDAMPSMDYVVIMHRVDFTAAPIRPVVTTDLFGTAPEQARITLTATRGAATEVAELRSGAASHEFFVDGGGLFADWMQRFRSLYSTLVAAIAR